MTTREETQLAVLVSEVGDLKEAMGRLEKRLIGGNGDGMITRLRLIEQRVKSRLWLERSLIVGVVLLLVGRVADLVMATPAGVSQ